MLFSAFYQRRPGFCGGFLMPHSEIKNSLYGVEYDCRRVCPQCGAYNWYDLKETEYLLCLDCGHQEPL